MCIELEFNTEDGLWICIKMKNVDYRFFRMEI